MDSMKTLPFEAFSKNELVLQLKSHWAIICGAAVTFFLVTQVIPFAYQTYQGKGRIDLPGPSGWPVFGIGIDLPSRPRKMLTDWANKYGSVCKVRVGWYDWVILSSREAVKEVFDKQVR